MEKKRSKKYELRFEVASERNKIAGYTLIHKHDRSAEAQHMTELYWFSVNWNFPCFELE